MSAQPAKTFIMYRSPAIMGKLLDDVYLFRGMTKPDGMETVPEALRYAMFEEELSMETIFSIAYERFSKLLRLGGEAFLLEHFPKTGKRGEALDVQSDAEQEINESLFGIIGTEVGLRYKTIKVIEANHLVAFSRGVFGADNEYLYEGNGFDPVPSKETMYLISISFHSYMRMLRCSPYVAVEKGHLNGTTDEDWLKVMEPYFVFGAWVDSQTERG